MSAGSETRGMNRDWEGNLNGSVSCRFDRLRNDPDFGVALMKYKVFSSKMRRNFENEKESVSCLPAFDGDDRYYSSSRNGG
jgi:hypothetical protein